MAGSTPLTTDDLDLISAINSGSVYLDVLNNDYSGISNDDFKEVIAVCDASSTDQDCTGNSFSNATGSVSINGAGDDNNILFSSNSMFTGEFDFKYIMQNSMLNTGSAIGKVTLDHYEVNALSDAGTQGCDAAECTLREAIVNAALGTVDNNDNTIRFNRDLQGTITLQNPLVIDDALLEIIGPGADQIIISGDNQYRVFNLTAVAESVLISGLTISNGNTTGNGAGVFIDGARNIVLESLRITGNQSNTDGGGLYFSSGSGIIQNSEISGNHANGKGGGIGITGSFGSDVFVDNVTISGNTSDDEGAGFYIDAGNGQNVRFRYTTTAFNSTGSFQIASNKVESGGNINFEASIVVSNDMDLVFNATNNLVNNSIIGNYSGVNFTGDNNLTETGVALAPLASINETNLQVHKIEPDSIAYNYVDDNFGKVGCGTVIPTDQIGTLRPVDQACDAGAYEYIFIDLIFASDFE